MSKEIINEILEETWNGFYSVLEPERVFSTYNKRYYTKHDEKYFIEKLNWLLFHNVYTNVGWDIQYKKDVGTNVHYLFTKREDYI